VKCDRPTKAESLCYVELSEIKILVENIYTAVISGLLC